MEEEQVLDKMEWVLGVPQRWDWAGKQKMWEKTGIHIYSLPQDPNVDDKLDHFNYCCKNFKFSMLEIF